MQGVREYYRGMGTTVGVTAIDASADSITVNGRDIVFMCVSGNVWINPNATAVADATSLKLTPGTYRKLMVPSVLSVISDGTGGTYQYYLEV